jgi:hypothetical protein
LSFKVLIVNSLPLDLGRLEIVILLPFGLYHVTVGPGDPVTMQRRDNKWPFQDFAILSDIDIFILGALSEK